MNAKPMTREEVARRVAERLGLSIWLKENYAGPVWDALISSEMRVAELENYDVRPFSPMTPSQAGHVEHWLRSNEKWPADVLWSLYPIGMVQRWIERAEKAEARVQELEAALELGKNLAINTDDFLHLTYRIDNDAKRKEIGGGILTALRDFRKKAEAALSAKDKV